jgi:hypothetical protein
VTNIAGTLAATLSAGNQAILRSHGKPVTKLAEGWYRIRVTASSPRATFTLGKAGGGTQALAPNRTVSVDLTVGTWKYYSSSHGAIHTFKVTAS